MDSRPAARRWEAALWLLPVLALGILSRLLPVGHLLWDKYLGDALYASAFYLGFTLLWPRASQGARTLLTMGYVLGIELFQLTGLPVYLKQSEHFVVWLFAYAILGSHFSLWDLLAYAVGIGAMALLLAFTPSLRRPRLIQRSGRAQQGPGTPQEAGASE